MAREGPDFKVFPPAAAGGALALALVLEWLLPLGLLPPSLALATALPGFALIAAAFLLVAMALLAFKRAETNVDVRKPALALVETGPYRFTRNPMYVSMITLLLGLGLAFSLDWALPLAPVLWAALHFGTVLREEAYLTRKFGAPYEAFLARTRRWL